MEENFPDEKTIWLFREVLTKKGIVDLLFKKFNHFLEQNGFKAQKGMIVDATIVAVPKQRNSRDENKEIKNGRVPHEWDKNLAKQRQKNTDVSCLKKNWNSYFSYKNHICIDNKNKIIRKYTTTPIRVHGIDTLAIKQFKGDIHIIQKIRRAYYK